MLSQCCESSLTVDVCKCREEAKVFPFRIFRHYATFFQPFFNRRDPFSFSARTKRFASKEGYFCFLLGSMRLTEDWKKLFETFFLQRFTFSVRNFFESRVTLLIFLSCRTDESFLKYHDCGKAYDMFHHCATFFRN